MSVARQGWCTIALLAIVVVGGISPAARAASGPNTVLPFNIPAGRLVDRMDTFALQSQLQVLYKFDGTENLTTRAVLGDFTPKDALKQMLEGTDIVPEFVKPQTVALMRRAALGADAAIGTGRGGSWVRRNQSAWQPTDRRGTQSKSDAETVLVSASRSFAEATLGDPLLSLDHRDIEKTGAATVPDFVRTLPQVFGGGATEDTQRIGREAASNSARGSGINLRGFDAGATLVVINGHRLAVGGTEGSFVDVASLPLLAVERFEITPASFSTQYGADATGGTVNIILRNNFRGRLTAGHFGTTTEGGLTESLASQIFGGSTEHGSGLVSIEYYTRDGLEARQRAQVTSDLTRFGGSNFSLPFTTPGTIVAGGTTWAIPRGQDGSNLDPRTLRPGTQNLGDQWEGADVLSRQQRLSLFGTWKNEITDSLSLFTDVLSSKRGVRGAGAPAGALIPVPPTNAFYVNPAGVGPVLVYHSFAKELGPVIGDGEVKTDNYAVGLDWDFAPLWHLVGTTTYASERLQVDFENSLNRDALLGPLLDGDRRTALNLFSDGNHTNPATLEKLRTTSSFDSHSYLRSANLTLNGPVLSLPGGSLWLTAGADYRDQNFSTLSRSTSVAAPLEAASKRTVTSLFAELQVPLWDEHNRHAGLERLAFSVGGRYENYSDFGSEITPRYGLEWSPHRDLTVRSSWARSFRPPSLMDKNESHNVSTVTPLFDPSAPGRAVLGLLWGGNNADLKQETARSWTAGLDYKPSWEPRLSFATTYFDIHFNDRLTAPQFTPDLLVNPQYAELVTRHPTSAQIAEVCARAPQSALTSQCGLPVDAIVDLRLRNDAYVHTSGFDMIAKYVRETSRGTLSLGLNGTRIIDFEVAQFHGAPLEELVSTQNHPLKLRLRGSLGWKHGALDSTVYANYATDYRDIASLPNRHVSSLTTFDVNLAYTLSEAHGGWLGETVFSLSGQNVFDRDPPFLNNAVGVGYDQENADILGRFVSFTVRQSW